MKKPRRGTSLSELCFPMNPSYSVVRDQLLSQYVSVIVSSLWKAIELLKAEVVQHYNVADADADLERGITQLIEPRVRKFLPDDCPFYVQHGTFEMETRLPPPAQSPAYDLAFVLNQNPRICWPVEAKVLRTPGQIAPYLADIVEQFLTCRYAPFSGSGAMMAYLLDGDVDLLAQNLTRNMEDNFVKDDEHLAQYISTHQRTVPEGKNYPAGFQCYHILVSF